MAVLPPPAAPTKLAMETRNVAPVAPARQLGEGAVGVPAIRPPVCTRYFSQGEPATSADRHSRLQPGVKGARQGNTWTTHPKRRQWALRGAQHWPRRMLPH